MSISQGASSGLIQSGLNIGQSIFQSLISGIQNRRQRKYEQKMYGKNLQDSRDSWSLQNQYNDPAQQMLRLKQAGLNPNLAYGGTSTGNAGNISTPSPSISKPQDIQAPAAPQLNDIYNLSRTDAQTDLLRSKVISEGLSQTLMALSTAAKDLELSKDRATYQTQIDQIKANLTLTNENIRSQQLNQDKTRAETTSIIDENIRKWSTNDLTLKQMAENILNTQADTVNKRANLGLINAQTENTKQNTLTGQTVEDLNALDYVMTRTGFNKNDTVVQRGIKNFLSLITKNKKAAQAELEKLKQYLQKH